MSKFHCRNFSDFLAPNFIPAGKPPWNFVNLAPHITDFCSHVLFMRKKELQYHLEMLIETQLARNFWCNNSIFSNWPKSLWKQIAKKCPLAILKDAWACLKMRYPVTRSISFVPNMNQPPGDLGEPIKEWENEQTAKLKELLCLLSWSSSMETIHSLIEIRYGCRCTIFINFPYLFPKNLADFVNIFHSHSPAIFFYGGTSLYHRGWLRNRVGASSRLGWN